MSFLGESWLSRKKAKDSDDEEEDDEEDEEEDDEEKGDNKRDSETDESTSRKSSTGKDFEMVEGNRGGGGDSTE